MVTHEDRVREEFARVGLDRKLEPHELEAEVRAEVARLEASTGSTIEGSNPTRGPAPVAVKLAPRERAHAEPAPPPPPREYACETCHDMRALRVTADRDDSAFGTVVECVCVPLEARARRAGVPERYLDARERWIVDPAKPLERAIGWIDGERGQLVLASVSDGPRWGTGKTHIAAVLALRELALGRPARFLYAADYLAGLRSRFASNGGPAGAAEAYADEIARAPFLVLDDLGAEHGTAWAETQLRSLIDARYRTGVRTVYTTNHARPAEVATDLGGAVGSRLLDATWIAVGGADMRGQR